MNIKLDKYYMDSIMHNMPKTLEDHQRQAVLRRIAEELLVPETSVAFLAKKYNVERATIYNYLKKIGRKRNQLEPISDEDFKTALKPKAVAAVQDGLDCPEDPYKRGALGIQFLKGTGDLQPDGMVGLNLLIQNIPSDLKEEFKALSDSNEQ